LTNDENFINDKSLVYKGPQKPIVMTFIKDSNVLATKRYRQIQNIGSIETFSYNPIFKIFSTGWSKLKIRFGIYEKLFIKSDKQGNIYLYLSGGDDEKEFLQEGVRGSQMIERCEKSSVAVYLVMKKLLSKDVAKIISNIFYWDNVYVLHRT
jgi:hypothetical protein